MTRRISLLCLFALWLTSLHSATIHHKIEFDTSKIALNTQEFNDTLATVISWGDMYPSGFNGGYALPVTHASFAIPCGATDVVVKNVKITNGEKLQLEHPVSLIQLETMNGDRIEEANPQTAAETYKKDVSPVTVFARENFQDVSDIVAVRISPLRYDQQRQTLQLYTSIEFDVEYSDASQMKTRSNSTQQNLYALDDLAMVRSMVANKEYVDNEIATVRNSTSMKAVARGQELVTKNLSAFGVPTYQYVVITNRELAPAFEQLISLKKIQGFDAGIVCMEDILANENFAKGDTISRIYDDAGKLRRYLFFAHKNGTRFVLLGGKPPIVPIRYGNCVDVVDKYHKDIPTDLYFGNVKDDWNKNNNQSYGEISHYDDEDNEDEVIDKLDFSCQLFVGRLLCKTRQEVINYTNKLEDYSLNPGNGDYSYIINGFLNFSYEFIDSDVVGGYPSDDMILSQVKPVVHRPTVNKQNREYPLGQDVMQELRQNKYGFFCLVSHGTPDGTSVRYHYPHKLSRYANAVTALDSEQIYYPKEDYNGLDNLDNIHYPSYSYSMACTTVPFDSPKYKGYGIYDEVYDGLTYNYGESYTLGQNYGGAVYLGNTRYGYKKDSEKLMARFFIALYEGYQARSWGIYAGVAEALSKMKNAYDGCDYCRLSHNLIGDPATAIWVDPPIVDEGFVIDRRDNVIDISATVNTGRNYERTWSIAIEPDGTVHRHRNGSFNNIHPSSLIYVIEDRYKPFIGDAFMQNVDLGKDQYFHVRNLCIGGSVMKCAQEGDAVVKSGTSVTFDVQRNSFIDGGTIIEPNATLTVRSKNHCYIRGIDVKDGGKLVVYADTVTLPTHKHGAGEIIVYKYNKYYEDKEELVTVRHSPERSKTSHAELPYTPMLEVGKEWRYTLWNDIVFEPDDPTDEGEMVIRIEDCKEIDGKKYYTMASYVNGIKDEEGRENNRLYSENCEEKKVYSHYKNSKGEIKSSLKYDFMNPLEGNTAIQIVDSPVYPTTYEAFGKSYNAFECGDQKRYRLVEGLGFISSEKLENIDYAQCMGTILTGPTLGCTGYCTIPKIYEIVNGAGEVIYSLPSARPGASAEMPGSDPESIEVTELAIEIRSSKPIGDVVVYTPAGTQVRNMHISDNRYSIPLTDYAPGVYILRTNGSSRKFIVR